MCIFTFFIANQRSDQLTCFLINDSDFVKPSKVTLIACTRRHAERTLLHLDKNDKSSESSSSASLLSLPQTAPLAPFVSTNKEEKTKTHICKLTYPYFESCVEDDNFNCLNFQAVFNYFKNTCKETIKENENFIIPEKKQQKNNTSREYLDDELSDIDNDDDYEDESYDEEDDDDLKWMPLQKTKKTTKNKNQNNTQNIRHV